MFLYRAGEFKLVEEHLNGIENDNLRQLIASMISLNPNDRKSAETYILEEHDRLFPAYFYKFLQPYMFNFASAHMTPDDKIMRIYADITLITYELGITSNHGEPLPDFNVDCETHENGIILMITVVTSNIRGINHCITKLRCLDILKQFATYTTSDNILDRIMPYIVIK